MLKPGEHVEQEQHEDGLRRGHAHLVVSQQLPGAGPCWICQKTLAPPRKVFLRNSRASSATSGIARDSSASGAWSSLMLSSSRASSLQLCKSEACSPAVPRIAPGNVTLWLKVPVCYPASVGFPRHAPGIVRSSAVTAGKGRCTARPARSRTNWATGPPSRRKCQELRITAP